MHTDSASSVFIRVHPWQGEVSSVCGGQLRLSCDADAGSMTGETIVVDGGLTQLGTIQLHPSK